MKYSAKSVHQLDSKFIQTMRTLAMFVGLVSGGAAIALPELNNVSQGDIGVVKDTSSLQVNQTSDKAIVNWNSFNIDAHEKVHFQQPIDGMCLNRIDAANGMSNIAGQLSATGTILLVNGAGVLFAEGAQVNAAGIIASVNDIADQNFLQDKMHFDQSDAKAAVINKGTIAVDDMAILFGSNVVNTGTIIAKSGVVGLGSGNKVSFDLYGDGVLNFALEPATTNAVDQNGAKIVNGVDMSGKIINDGGMVVIAANAVPEIFDNLINMSGEVRAVSTRDDLGTIVLLSTADHGAVKVDGVLDASGVDTETSGGMIGVVGANIKVTGNSVLSSAGEQDGGVIVIGNVMSMKLEHVNFPATQNLDVEKGAILDVDSKTNGDAGHITVTSAHNLTFNGTATARGGIESGDGGDISVISRDLHDQVDKSKLDVSSPKGEAGSISLSEDYESETNATV